MCSLRRDCITRLGGVLLLATLLSLLAGCEPPFQTREAERGIYRIITRVPSGQFNFGTGFLIAGDDIVVASWKDVADAKDIYIVIPERRWRTVRAQVINKDERRDVALLRANRPLPAKPLPLATYRPASGSDIKAIGFAVTADYQLTQLTKKWSVMSDQDREKALVNELNKYE